MKSPNKPLKRHKALQALSREHHHGLLLCWKIKTGFKNHIATEAFGPMLLGSTKHT